MHSQEDVLFSNDILLSVENVTATGLTMNIENRTSEELVYGVDYTLEQYVDDRWEGFDIGPIAVILIAKMLPPQGLVQETLEWSHTYGTLEPGHYRVVKRIGPHTTATTFTV